MITEIQALQNAANSIGLTIEEKYQEDRRKTVKMYFAIKDNKSISPSLDYDNMNHFLLGYRKSNEILNQTMQTYQIQDREAGNVIRRYLTKESAELKLKEYEAADMADGTFTPNFYEIVEMDLTN